MTKEPLITRKTYREHKKKTHKLERQLPWRISHANSAEKAAARSNSLSESLAAKKVESQKKDLVTKSEVATPKIANSTQENLAANRPMASVKKRFRLARADDDADKQSGAENKTATQNQAPTDNQSAEIKQPRPIDKFLNIGIGLFLVGIIIVTSIAIFI